MNNQINYHTQPILQPLEYKKIMAVRYSNGDLK